MSSEISADNAVNGDITNTSGKNIDAPGSSAALPNQDRTSNPAAGESSDITQTQSSTPNATSTFKALSAGSYAERIRTSVQSTENPTSTKIGGNAEEESVGGSKAGSGNSGEGKPNSGKRTGKNKSGSNAAQHRSSTPRVGATGETATPNASTTSSDTGVTKQGKSETAVQHPEESEQGWQEVTAKPRNQSSNKSDKKEASSSGSGRQKQYGKKSSVGTTSDESAVSPHVNEKPNKGKSAPSRKEKEKSDKDSRQQQAQGSEVVAPEPTRKQQQQQKDKESTGAKSLGMKSASWRSSPLAVAFMAAGSPGNLEDALSPTTATPTTNTTTTTTETSPPGQHASKESTSLADDALQTGNEPIQQQTMTSTQNGVEPNNNDQDKVAATNVKVDTVPAPAVPAVNIWQLRKEKMKSSSTKQAKQSSSSNNNGKSVFGSLTGAVIPSSGDGSSSSKAAAVSKSDTVSGKRQATGSTQQESHSSGGNAASKSSLKTGSASSPNPPPTSLTQSKQIRPTTVTPTTAAPVTGAAPSATLTDVMTWPDVAASAVKAMNIAGGEGRKKEREEEENAQAIVVNTKKGKPSHILRINLYFLC